MVTNFIFSVEDLNSVLEEYVKSEIACSKSKKIYSAFENILIRKEYLHNLETVPNVDEMKICDTSNHYINKNKSSTKVTNSMNKSKNVHSSAPNTKHFVILQKQIQQYESYKNCLNHVSNKYPTEFLNLLDAQVKLFYLNSYIAW